MEKEIKYIHSGGDTSNEDIGSDACAHSKESS